MSWNTSSKLLSDVDPSRPLLSSTLPYPSPHRVLTSTASVDASFARFTSSLQRRITYRTPLLDSVLSELDVQANSLWSDLENVATNSATLRSALLEGYSPKADQTCACLAGELERRTKQCTDNQQCHSVVFLGRVAHELRSSSTFNQRFGASEDGAATFQQAMTRLHDRSIEVWREAAVARAFEEALPATKPKADPYRTSGPYKLPIFLQRVTDCDISNCKYTTSASSIVAYHCGSRLSCPRRKPIRLATIDPPAQVHSSAYAAKFHRSRCAEHQP